MISVEKPGSPSEVLEQSGVKGMKWGVRQSRQASRDFGMEFPTGRSRAAEIRRARRDQATRKEKIGNAPKGSKERAKFKKAYLNNPDRVTSLRLTRGEKVVAGVILALGSPTGILPAATLGYVGTTYAVRRRRESRMARGIETK